MVAIRYITLLLTLSLVAVSPSSSSSAGIPVSDHAANPETLFAQSAGVVLNRDFPRRNISFLLLDARSGEVLTSRWEHPDAPIPLGSLSKPFTALAYGERHDYKYPAHICRGTATGCWLPRGHGEVDLTAAIAYSCNSYFRMITVNMTAADVSPTAERFGIESPDRRAAGPALVGLGPGWRISPLRMARAYLELVRRREQPGVREVLEGMAQSGLRGTGAEVVALSRFPTLL